MTPDPPSTRAAHLRLALTTAEPHWRHLVVLVGVWAASVSLGAVGDVPGVQLIAVLLVGLALTAAWLGSTAYRVVQFEVLDQIERTATGVKLLTHRFAPREREIDAERVLGYRLRRDGLTVFVHGSPPIALYLPDPSSHVPIRAVLDPLQPPPRSPLKRAVVGVTHDGVRLRLDPVFSPPSRLAMALLVSIAAPMAGLGPWLVVAALAGVPSAGTAAAVLLAAAAALVAIAAAVGRQVVEHVELAVEGTRLVLRTRSALRTVERAVPLVDVEGVELARGRICLRTTTGRVVIPMAQRSPRMVQEVAGFLGEQVRRTVDLRGSVPAELGALTGGARRSVERER